jgi:hypothetical protein
MNWLIPIVVPILVPLVLFWLAKKYPYKAPENLELPDLETLTIKYRKADRIAGIFTFITFILLCCLIGNLLYTINHLFIEINKLVVFQVLPDHFWWNGFSIIFSFGITCSYLMMMIYRIHLKENTNEYVVFNNLRSGFNSIKLVKRMGYFFILFSVWGYCFLWNYSAKIYKDKMVIRWFLSLDNQSYKYDQIKSINFIKNTAPHFDIIFKDGMDWNSQNGLDDDEKDSAILKFVSEKSRVKIDTLSNDPKY